MRKPIVSVVMPAYNHEDYIGEAIQSVLDQTLTDLELIIINDGSTDKTEQVIKSFQDERIKYYDQDNQGAHNTINRGLSLSNGQYITIINSDDIYNSERLNVLLSFAKEKDAKFLFTRVGFIGDDEGYKNILTDWYNKLNTIYEDTKSVEQTLLSGNVAITSSNFFFSSDLREDLGDFQSYKYVHDYDFILRALIHYSGKCLYISDQTLLQYRVHGSNTIRESYSEATKETIALLVDCLPAFRNDPANLKSGLGYIMELSNFLVLDVERNSNQILDKDKMIKELEDSIQNKSMIIDQKEKVIKQIEEILKDRDNIIRDQDKIIKDKDKLIIDITSSYSWILTAPLRRLKGMFYK